MHVIKTYTIQKDKIYEIVIYTLARFLEAYKQLMNKICEMDNHEKL